LESGERKIVHVDMDAFYASVEVLDDPGLCGKPVIVGGTPEERGVVAASSYEARRYGVHSAMSAARARKLCSDGVFLRPRFERYAELSRQVFGILEDYTPLVEKVSIDEGFLDLTGCSRTFGDAVDTGRKIKRRIRDEVRLTASVGVAPNKFLAKTASELEKPDGFVVITAANAQETLASLPVRHIWGVGPVTEKTLSEMGVHKVADLLDFPRAKLERRLGSFAERLLDLARGIDESPVEPDAEAKSVSSETTFHTDIADAGELRHHLDALAERVARELREKGLRTRTVSMKARYPDFKTVTRAVTLGQATASTQAIRDAARELLEDRLGRRGRLLRLLGVKASNLSAAGEGQMLLFADESDRRHERLDRLLDELRRRYGPDIIVPGSQIEPPPREEKPGPE